MSVEVLQVKQYGKTNKIIKDLKERNDKLAEQYRLRDIRCISLERENERLQQKVEQLENIIKEVSEYMEHYIEIEDAPINERIKIEFKEVLNILNKGSEKD